MNEITTLQFVTQENLKENDLSRIRKIQAFFAGAMFVILVIISAFAFVGML